MACTVIHGLFPTFADTLITRNNLRINFAGSGSYGSSYNRGRDGSRGGPRAGSGRGGRGGGGHSGMVNGYNQRGGGRPNSFSNSRGGGYNGNNRGGSRGIVTSFFQFVRFLALNVFVNGFLHEKITLILYCVVSRHVGSYVSIQVSLSVSHHAFMNDKAGSP